MSEGIMQNLTPRRFRTAWLIFIVIYLFVCALSALSMASFEKRAQATIKAVRAKQIEKIMKDRELRENATPEDLKYYESLYSHSGGINPGFKKMVANTPTYREEPKQRAYEQQLAQYQAKVAEMERQKREEKRRLEEQAAKERALAEEERQERLREQAALQAQASQPVQVSGGIGPSKTFTAPKTQQPKAATQQKTVIGTLKTSKLGESSFQSGKF